MRGRQVFIFPALMLLIIALSFAYSAQVLADLKQLYKGSTDVRGVELILIPDDNTMGTAQESALLAARQVVDDRLDKMQLAGPYHVIVEGNQLTAKLPASENMLYIASVVSSIGDIEFIDGGVSSPPIGQRIRTAERADPERNVFQALFAGHEIETATIPDPASGQIFYKLRLKPTATQRFSDFVQTHPQSYICMVMDGQVINCSTMYHFSGDTIEILPGLSSGAAINLADLAIFLDSDPLPMPLRVVMP